MRIKSIASAFLFVVLFIVGLSAQSFSASTFSRWRVLGPTGGDVRKIVVDPKNQDHLFVSTLDGQVYASYDAGENWKLLANFRKPQLVLDNLIVDPRDSNLIYTAGHRHKVPGGFFKTSDGGKTWRESPELKNQAIQALYQAQQDPNLLLAGTVTGIWMSRDSGDTWTELDSETTPEKLDSLAIDPEDLNTFYAGTWWRAYKSTDAGKSWKLIKDGMIDDSDVFAIDIDPADPDKIIAGACSGIYLSLNKGEQWKKVQGIPSQSRRTRDIIHNPGKEGYVYAGTTEGLWMSTDSGSTWRLTTSKTVEINSIAVNKDNPNKVFLGTNNFGVMVSEDGGRSFKVSNGNFTSRFAYNIVGDLEKPNRIYATTVNTATGGGFVFVSNDFGVTWNEAVTNIDTDRTIVYSLLQDKAAPNNLYLATSAGVFKSANRGVSWTKPTGPASKRVKKGRRWITVKPKLAAGMVATISEAVMVLSPTNDGKNGLIAGTTKGLYRTYDMDGGWKKINLGAGITPTITSIYVAPEMPQIIWVGTATSGLIMSNDGGETWTKTGLSAGVPISSIASDPTKPENLFVGTTQTFYLSRDLGKTWVRRGGNLPIGNYTSILIDPGKPSEMYISSSLDRDGGVFFSEDNGWSWSRIDLDQYNLPSRRVWSLTFSPGNPDQILAASHSAGIYQISRDRGTSVEITDETAATESQ
ncbi:MAG: hypothetical protein R2684_17340 [Pyrinomonadaceae bacterium]